VKKIQNLFVIIIMLLSCCNVIAETDGVEIYSDTASGGSFYEDFETYNVGDSMLSNGWSVVSGNSASDVFGVTQLGENVNKVLKYYDCADNGEPSQFTVKKTLSGDMTGKIKVKFRMNVSPSSAGKRIRFKDRDITNTSSSSTSGSPNSANQVLLVGQWSNYLRGPAEFGSIPWTDANDWFEFDITMNLTGTPTGNTADFIITKNGGTPVKTVNNVAIGGTGVLRCLVVDTDYGKPTSTAFFDDFQIYQLQPPQNTEFAVLNSNGSVNSDINNLAPVSSFKLKFESTAPMSAAGIASGIKLMNKTKGTQTGGLKGSIEGSFDNALKRYIYYYTLTPPALDSGDEYGVMVTADCADDMNTHLAQEKEWAVKVSANPLEITMNTNVTDTAAECDVNIINNSGDKKDLLAVLGIYKDNIMKNITSRLISVLNGGSASDKLSINNVPADGQAKAFTVEKQGTNIISEPLTDSAQNGIINIAQPAQDEPTKLAISGNAGIGNSELNLFVLKPNKTISDISADNLAASVQYIDHTKTDENGSYSFTWKNEDSTASGYFTVVLQRAYGQPNIAKQFFYNNPYEAQQTVDTMKADKNSAIAIMTGKALVLGLDIARYGALGTDGKQYVNQDILNGLNDVKTPSDLQGLYNLAVTVQEINSVTDKNTLLAKIFSNEQYLSLKNSDIYENMYKNPSWVSAEMQPQVCDLVTKEDIKTDADLTLKFEDAVIFTSLSGIGSYKKCYDILAKANSALGIDFDGYNSLSSEKKEIAQKLFAKDIDSMTDRETVAAKFASAVETAENTKTGGGSGGGNAGGGSHSSVISSAADLSKAAELMPIPSEDKVKTGLTDLKETPWAKDSIEKLYKFGLVNGYEDNTFKPNNNITRAEFTTLVIKCFVIGTEEGKCDYVDVAKDDWAYPYIAAASSIGVINGKDSDFFAPESKISREEMVTIIYRTMKYLQVEPDKSRGNLLFRDENDISNFAKEPVEYLYSVGLINGKSEDEFAPKGFATRAEACKILSDIISKR